MSAMQPQRSILTYKHEKNRLNINKYIINMSLWDIMGSREKGR